MDGQNIEEVEATNFLDPLIDHSVSWDIHVREFCGQLARIVFHLKSLKKYSLSTEILLQVYHALFYQKLGMV